MPTILEAPKSEFTPHPEGTFIAVCRDTYLETRPNPWKGQQRDSKDPSKGVDDRETITELHMEFLTDHPVEIKGDLLPGFVRYTATASLAENSNLRKFLKGWFPALKDEHFQRFDADKLIGRGAYITVGHRTDKKGNVWANVIGAMQPPKDASLPMIPKDFVRHETKKAMAAQQAPQQAAPVAQPSQKMPPPDLKVQQQQARHAPPLTAEENSLPELDKHEVVDDSEVNPW
jgi:hypothetical protein